VTLLLNSAQENNQPYALLHLINETPIECFETDLPLGQKEYTCQFDKILTNEIKSQKTPLVEIEFIEHAESFEIVITPAFRSVMKNMDATLHEDMEVPLPPSGVAKHWTILIYQELPFQHELVEDGINFPVAYEELKRPNVGALDLNGAPIGYVRSRDINAYLDLKKNYEAGRFEIVMEDAQEAMMLYPQTIFRSEFALYKLRAMDRLLDAETSLSQSEIDRNDVINEGKAWMKSFPSDENMTEVLMYIAKNYLKMGFTSDANYFLDILITEYPEDDFTKQAILLYADTLYNGTKRVEALRLYNDVLYTAKDLDTASEAAIRLAQNSIDEGKAKEAKEYLTKILNANASFLLKEEESAYALAEKLANNGLPDIAAQITEALLEERRCTDPLYENLLKDTGLWYAQAGDVKKGDMYLSRYQGEFANGEFAEAVQEGQDRLFFELSETNTTQLNAYYDTLMERYDNEISQKALVEKAKLFNAQEAYEETLALDEPLRGIEEETLQEEAMNVLKQAALSRTSTLFQEDQCQRAVSLIERYEIGGTLENREKYFECMMRLSRDEKAIEEAKSHLNGRDLRERLAWMMRLNKAFLANGDWQEVVDLSDDILELGVLVKKPEAKEALYEKFFALQGQKEHEAALGVAQEIMKELPNTYRSAEVYMAIIRFAKDQGNDMLVERYAKEALALQERMDVYLYSPDAEYEAIQALQRLEKNEAALEITEALIARTDSPQVRIRAHYYAGELTTKLGQDEAATRHFRQCAESPEESTWKSVCEEVLALEE
jgi:hypothetical protein